jgi:hypothetical protein
MLFLQSPPRPILLEISVRVSQKKGAKFNARPRLWIIRRHSSRSRSKSSSHQGFATPNATALMASTLCDCATTAGPNSELSDGSIAAGLTPFRYIEPVTQTTWLTQPACTRSGLCAPQLLPSTQGGRCDAVRSWHNPRLRLGGSGYRLKFAECDGGGCSLDSAEDLRALRQLRLESECEDVMTCGDRDHLSALAQKRDGSRYRTASRVNAP